VKIGGQKAGMMARAAGLCAIVALALATSACSQRLREVTPTPQLVKQLGLPVYPNAKLTRRGAQQMTMSSRLGETVSLIVSYETTDDFAKVREFYEQRLPSTKRVISIPLGQVNDVTMQFHDKAGQKQVTLVSLRGVTMIQLQSTTLSFAPPSAEPSGAAPAPSFSPNSMPAGGRYP
jgi:hypothetical protein